MRNPSVVLSPRRPILDGIAAVLVEREDVESAYAYGEEPVDRAPLPARLGPCQTGSLPVLRRRSWPQFDGPLTTSFAPAAVLSTIRRFARFEMGSAGRELQPRCGCQRALQRSAQSASGLIRLSRGVPTQNGPKGREGCNPPSCRPATWQESRWTVETSEHSDWLRRNCLAAF